MSPSISLHISILGHLQHLAQSAIKTDHGMNQRHRHGVSLMKELPTELDQHDITFDWLPVQNECQQVSPEAIVEFYLFEYRLKLSLDVFAIFVLHKFLYLIYFYRVHDQCSRWK
jgi:hypothetical protein